MKQQGEIFNLRRVKCPIANLSSIVWHRLQFHWLPMTTCLVRKSDLVFLTRLPLLYLPFLCKIAIFQRWMGKALGTKTFIDKNVNDQQRKMTDALAVWIVRVANVYDRSGRIDERTWIKLVPEYNMQSILRVHIYALDSPYSYGFR